MDAFRSGAFRSAVPVAVLACCAALLSGCSDSGSTDESEGVSAQAADRAGDGLEDAYQKVIKDVLPSVVQIRAAGGLGSGIVYDTKGHLVTNAHVVVTANAFAVTTTNSEDVLRASLVFSYRS